MANAVDQDFPSPIGDFINDTIISYTNTPVTFTASQFAATGGTWVACEGLNGSYYASLNVGRKPPQVLLCAAFEQDALFALAIGEILLQRTIMARLTARTLQPCQILTVFQTLQQFLIIFDRNDD